MTERLYYSDSYLTTFEARIVEEADSGHRIYLDRTAFYPASGGQPSDRGTLGGRALVDVVEEGERVAHIVEAPIADRAVAGTIDWERRFDFMQQHTGQHLLSAVFAERFGLETVSVHLGDDASTIDLQTSSFDPALLAAAEEIANREIAANRPTQVTFEDAATASGLRKASAREGMLRIVAIEGLDRSACGGTHVRATGEIGAILLGRTEKVRQTTRVEFYCGLRAIQTTRSSGDTLRKQVSELQERIAAADKELRKLSAELAGYRGRELHATTPPGPDGLRRFLRRADGIDDGIRAEAQAFTVYGKALYLAVTGDAILLAVSADSGWHAGNRIKPLVTKGGGSATMAQGAVSDAAAAIADLGFAA